MLKKEISEIWLPVLLRLGVAMTLPLAALIAKREFNAAVVFLLLIGLFMTIAWIANTLGLTAFKVEKNDRAWEYFFTFPYSRVRLLSYKVGPRALVLLALLGLYALVFALVSPWLEGLHWPELLTPSLLALVTLVLFVSCLSLSLFDLKNLRLLAGLPWFLFFLFLCEGVSRIMSQLNLNRGARFLPDESCGALIVVAITGISFWGVFRRFDLQGDAVHLRRYLTLALPPALLVFLATLWAIVRR
jgi:hypothetical protein